MGLWENWILLTVPFDNVQVLCTFWVYCFFFYTVLVDPDTPSIINGGVMTLTGPSFNTTSSHEKITCVFTDDDGDVTEGIPRQLFTRPIQGIIVYCKAICPMPLFRKLGPHNLTVMLNDTKFVGQFEVGKGGVDICVWVVKTSLCIY